jgi:hypothetical protein
MFAGVAVAAAARGTRVANGRGDPVPAVQVSEMQSGKELLMGEMSGSVLRTGNGECGARLRCKPDTSVRNNETRLTGATQQSSRELWAGCDACRSTTSSYKRNRSFVISLQ